MTNLARVTLAEVWAEFLGARNPIWRPASILKITFSTIWPTVMCNLWLMWYFGPRNWLVMLVLSLDPVLTFKTNMAPGGHLENCIFDTLGPSVVWLMLCGVFGGKEIIYDVSLMIKLGLDLQMQDASCCKWALELWSHRTARLAMSTKLLYGKMGRLVIICIRRVGLHCHLQPILKKPNNVNRKKIILINSQV